MKSCIIIEKHFANFTFKLTFVYTNVTESDYILQRTNNNNNNNNDDDNTTTNNNDDDYNDNNNSNNNKILICLIKDYLL